MADYFKLSIAQKSDMVILHVGTSNLRSDKTPSNMVNRIIKLARGIKLNGIEIGI